MDEVQEYEATSGLKASDQLLQQVRKDVVEAFHAFLRGIELYPNASISQSHLRLESFKASEWMAMAQVALAYTSLTSDFENRMVWTQHSVALLVGSLREDKTLQLECLEKISAAYLSFAMWIYEQPERPLLVYPEITPVFKEMQFAALAGQLYAKQAHEVALSENRCTPQHYCQRIDCTFMLSLSCISTELLHHFSQEATHWIQELEITFPFFDIEPTYIHAAFTSQAKSDAIHEIQQKAH
ncbi:hypothetical protein BGZ94_004290 [Podila epigama]|nr:hypothetical protein BGZ94_004290 [Podila epigama]